MQAEILPVLWPYVLKSLVGLAITGIGALMLYPIRYVKKAYEELLTAVNSTHAELVHQRENHLTHMEASGAEQVKLLSKMSDTLDGVRLDFKEHRAYVQGLVQSPQRPRSKK